MALIKCVECGKKISEYAEVCPNCGYNYNDKEINNEIIKCPECNHKVDENKKICQNCGFDLGKVCKSKVWAVILAMSCGVLGVHNFYLGYKGRGIAQLILTLIGLLTWIFVIGIIIICVVEIWAYIEGILILTGDIDHDASGKKIF